MTQPRAERNSRARDRRRHDERTTVSASDRVRMESLSKERIRQTADRIAITLSRGEAARSPAEAGHDLVRLLARFAITGQLPLELVTMPTARIIHRPLSLRLMWIGGWWILRVPVPVSLLVGVLIVSHCHPPGNWAVVATQQRAVIATPVP